MTERSPTSLPSRSPPQTHTLTGGGAALGQRVGHGGQEHRAVVDLSEREASGGPPAEPQSSGQQGVWAPSHLLSCLSPAAQGLPLAALEGGSWRAKF